MVRQPALQIHQAGCDFLSNSFHKPGVKLFKVFDTLYNCCLN